MEGGLVNTIPSPSGYNNWSFPLTQPNKGLRQPYPLLFPAVPAEFGYIFQSGLSSSLFPSVFAPIGKRTRAMQFTLIFASFRAIASILVRYRDAALLHAYTKWPLFEDLMYSAVEAMVITLGEYLGLFLRASPRCGRNIAAARNCAMALVSNAFRLGQKVTGT